MKKGGIVIIKERIKRTGGASQGNTPSLLETQMLYKYNENNLQKVVKKPVIIEPK